MTASDEDPPGGPTRRDLLRGLGGGLLAPGLDALARRLTGVGLLPAAHAQEGELIQLVARPLVLEPPPHRLVDAVTPAWRHFVRNHGLQPGRALGSKLEGWTLTIEGQVRESQALTMEDLRAFPAVTRAVVLQSSGYARREFRPRVRGIPFGRGAVGCARWTGARLADILAKVGVDPTATHILPEGEDLPISVVDRFQRGLPLTRALAEDTLVAYEMNGHPLPGDHGFPARLVVPGWVGSSWQKWLRRITVVGQEPTPQATRGTLYRIPREPMTPGTRPLDDAFQLVTWLPVQSLIVGPRAGEPLPPGEAFVVHGRAWGGRSPVARVEVSADRGATWLPAALDPPGDPHAWRGWSAKISGLSAGAHEVWARAHDVSGASQPLEPVWNPRGYLGNAVHRVPVQVGG